MPRRLEIELTSRTGDRAFTWRAAGARQPKGTVSEDLVPPGASVGDVVRAEVESGLDGLEVVAVLAKADKVEHAPGNRIEVLGAPSRGPDVVVTYAPGARRRRDEGTGRDGGRRGERPGRPERSGRAEGPGRSGPGRGQEGGSSTRRERPARPDAERGGRPEGDAERRGRAGRPEGDAERRGRAEGGERRGRPDDRRGPAGVRRDRRPTVSTAHRNALLGTLGPQEIPIAEQLLRGGIPAVRQALADQARQGAGSPAETNRDAVLAVAEQLLPRVNLATWKDRATSAQAAGKELRLRELRAVVTSSRTVTLDDEARSLAKTLHESLDQRVRALREEWEARMSRALGEGRVAEALAVAARPPEPATRLPAELAVRLAEAAGAAMTAETDSTEWRTLLDAVVESPVRRTVKPQGIPASSAAHEAARRAAGSVPELAKLLGLRIPPPPPPRRPGGAPRVMAAGGASSAGGR